MAANGSFIKQDSVVSRGLKADLTAKRLFCTTRSQSSQEEKLEKPKGVGSSRGGITKREAGKGTRYSSIRLELTSYRIIKCSHCGAAIIFFDLCFDSLARTDRFLTFTLPFESFERIKVVAEAGHIKIYYKLCINSFKLCIRCKSDVLKAKQSKDRAKTGSKGRKREESGVKTILAIPHKLHVVHLLCLKTNVVTDPRIVGSCKNRLDKPSLQCQNL